MLIIKKSANGAGMSEAEWQEMADLSSVALPASHHQTSSGIFSMRPCWPSEIVPKYHVAFL